MQLATPSQTLTFNQAVQGYLLTHGKLSFLQIGGYDGVSYDPLREHILSGKLTGVIVEPVPAHFDKLQALYRDSDHIKVENCAIDTVEGERTMWHFSREAIANGTLGEVFGGITSFLLPNLLEKSGTLGGLYTEANREILLSLVESISVRCCSYETIIARHNLEYIDLLQIDTEGYDYVLLKNFDFQRFRPAIVQYECQHLSPQDRQAAEYMLHSLGYMIHSNHYDTLAVRSAFDDAAKTGTPSLIAVAGSLLKEGRAEQAYAIFSHLLAAEPGNLRLMLRTARAGLFAGRYAEALRLMAYLKDKSIPGIDDITPFVHEAVAEATQAFNKVLAEDDPVAMEPIIGGLALLDPDRCLGRALTIAQRLKRIDTMADYAAQMFMADPKSWHAHAALYDIAELRGDPVSKLKHLAHIILYRHRSGKDDVWMLSMETYYAVSQILTRPFHPELPPLIEALRTAVADLPQEFSDPKREQADRFYRISLESLDISLLDEPLSDSPPPPPHLTFADFTGTVLEISQLPQRVLALKPRLAFLAAADVAYLRHYGRNYLKSILGRCDVNCAVIICVIGEAKALKGLIDDLGIRDPRLFYLVNEFDPSYAVSYYNKTAFRTQCANAYYQSVRFLILDYLLHILQIPLIISDIDIILQGSVAGILERHADAEVVLNKNDIEISFGSFFTANLVLIRPGRTSHHFARMLRVFLERALERDSIEQFIDQSGMVLSRHYCSKHGLDRFDHFIGKEINNLMFNHTDMDDLALNIARGFVFFAYYGSEGESAITLMNALVETE
ncbi:MAG: FkbM family methyltransferase [Ferrovibrio sp.]|uniref:FkbM family methyltransferase n=1 Tax=Ferrovibrio sp. TaxID=1917215 RepID=UPI0026377F93|nr:FkbM family methyltransferase [Ferrovibrio sp.]MCW0235580.1 FkbM family methyltransferase [Ferrovibrio sp.]